MEMNWVRPNLTPCQARSASYLLVVTRYIIGKSGMNTKIVATLIMIQSVEFVLKATQLCLNMIRHIWVPDHV